MPALLNGVCHNGHSFNAAAAVGIRIIMFQSFRHGRNLLLRLRACHAGLEPHVSFNPSRTAILQFVTAGFKNLLH